MRIRPLISLVTLLLPIWSWANELTSSQFCVENKLSDVLSAYAGYLQIGLAIEDINTPPSADSIEPQSLAWGKKKCFPINKAEKIIIYDSRLLGEWTYQKSFPTYLLRGVNLQIGKAGRVSNLYGINLVTQGYEQVPIPSPEGWMGELFSSAENIPLNELCIPGSHDTGTYNTTVNSAEDPHMDKAINNIFNYVRNTPLSLPVKEVIRRWAVTQPTTTYQQLSAGARYLDIRARKVDDILVTAHGLLGAQILDIVEDMKRFLTENPNELVIFHIQETHGMDDNAVNALFNLVNNEFSGQIAPSELLPTTPIQQFQKSGYQVIVISSRILSGSFSAWSRTTLDNRWHNKNRPDPLAEKLLEHVGQRRLNQLHVTQMVLTPTTEDIVQSFVPGEPSSLLDLVDTLRYPSGYLRLLDNEIKQYNKRLNIVLIDNIENNQTDFFNACMKINIDYLSK